MPPNEGPKRVETIEEFAQAIDLLPDGAVECFSVPANDDFSDMRKVSEKLLLVLGADWRISLRKIGVDKNDTQRFFILVST
ncbi:MAG: hypothetical protein AAB495_03300 [Patescibacteria group bacterium]